VQVLLQPLVRQTESDASALPTAVERHHQPGLLGVAAIAEVPTEAKTPMPAARQRYALLDVLGFGLPDQRAVAEEPEWTVRRGRDHLRDHLVVVGVGCRAKTILQLWAGVRNFAPEPGDVIGGQPHLPALPVAIRSRHPHDHVHRICALSAPP
jgi:hypothetical protein